MTLDAGCLPYGLAVQSALESPVCWCLVAIGLSRWHWRQSLQCRLRRFFTFPCDFFSVFSWQSMSSIYNRGVGYFFISAVELYDVLPCGLIYLLLHYNRRCAQY